MEMETTISLLDVRPFIPELTLICTGLILMLLDLVVKKKEIVAAVGIAGTIVALYGTYKLYGFYEPQLAFAGMFVLDGYANFFKLIFYLNVILTICISIRYLAVEKASFGEYYALLMFATTGMMIMASAGWNLWHFLLISLRAS
jgi:NADH-quinone oxidoreductase subunit N